LDQPASCHGTVTIWCICFGFRLPNPGGTADRGDACGSTGLFQHPRQDGELGLASGESWNCSWQQSRYYLRARITSVLVSCRSGASHDRVMLPVSSRDEIRPGIITQFQDIS
jgi:hypothetical protein